MYSNCMLNNKLTWSVELLEKMSLINKTCLIKTCLTKKVVLRTNAPYFIGLLDFTFTILLVRGRALVLNGLKDILTWNKTVSDRLIELMPQWTMTIPTRVKK